MEPTVEVAKIFGIELHLGYSWFLIFIFATVVLAVQFDNNFPNWAPLYHFFWGLATSLLFFISILGHEIAHSLIALHYKIRVHSIRLHVFGGWARLARPPKSAIEELAIAVAGPVCSLMFACLFGLVWLLFGETYPALALLSGMLAWINLILAVFNSLPGFPLDGGLVLRALVWHVNGNYTTATRFASYSGQILAFAFMACGMFFFAAVGLGGLWFLIIGYNLFSSSRAQLKDAELKEAFKSFKVGELSLQQLPQISSSMRIREFLDTHFAVQSGCYLVVDETIAVGLLTAKQASTANENTGDYVPINEVMTPITKVEVIDTETDVIHALELMDCAEATQLPVVNHQQLEGFISRESLIDFIAARAELGTYSYTKLAGGEQK